MGILHFLNVGEGDCSIIQHQRSGLVSVIDVCNASITQRSNDLVNPIAWLYGLGVDSIFRFILTHPEMDHMDGIKDLFTALPVCNFWDTDNRKVTTFAQGSRYREADWRFYQTLRGRNWNGDPRRLLLNADARGQFYNLDANGAGVGDGLYVLAPTPALTRAAKAVDDYNDASYVLLWVSAGGRVLFAGDSHDKTWMHLLTNYSAWLRDIDLLIAPHHGRHSDRSFDFLDVLRPKLTFFGTAPSEHLAYGAWNSRRLFKITNTEAGSMIVDARQSPMRVYVTDYAYAVRLNRFTGYNFLVKGYPCLEIWPAGLYSSQAAA